MVGSEEESVLDVNEATLDGQTLRLDVWSGEEDVRE
jgi:hypothetical protein